MGYARTSFFGAVHAAMKPETSFDVDAFQQKALSITGVEMLSQPHTQNLEAAAPILSQKI